MDIHELKYTFIMMVLYGFLGASYIVLYLTDLDLMNFVTLVPLGFVYLIALLIALLIPITPATSERERSILLLFYDMLLIGGILSTLVLLPVIQMTTPRTYYIVSILKYLSITGTLAFIGFYGRDSITRFAS